MTHNPVGWFEIYVQDMPRARAFYESVFQCSLQALDDPDPNSPSGLEMWSFPMEPEGAGASGALVHMPGVAPGGSTRVYFRCDDCAVEAGRAVSSGGGLVQGKTSIGPYGHIALVSDTEGNVIGLHSMQ